MELKEPQVASSDRSGFKRAEMGLIPSSWSERTLRSCLKSSPSYGINAAAVPYAHNLPAYLRITDISEDGRYLTTGKVSVKDSRVGDYFLNEGDIVLARTGASVGKSYRYRAEDGPLVYAGFLIKVTPDPKVLLAEYLEAVFNTAYYRNWVTVTSMRSGQPGVNGQEFGSLAIALPPIEEQRAIATVLSDVDGLLAGLDALIAKKKALKQGAMQQLLTGKQRLSGFKGEWVVRTFGELFHISGGYSASRDQLSSTGHPYLHYGDIHMSTRSTLDVEADYQHIPKLDVPIVQVPSRSLLKDGDVVFVDASEDDDGVSKYVVVRNPKGTPFISGLHTIVASARGNDLDPTYSAYCFQTAQLKKQFRFYAVGTKVSGISKSNIALLELPVPSLDEQRTIGAVLSDMDGELAALEARRAKTALLKLGMMQELLTGRVRLV